MDDWQKKNLERYKTALGEARRFIAKAELAVVEMHENDGYGSHVQQAAAKRASMDVTRSLAVLRSSLYR